MKRWARAAVGVHRADRKKDVFGEGLIGLLIASATFRSAQNMAQTTLSLLGKSLGLSGAAIGAVSAGSNLIGAATMVLFTARLATGSSRRAIAAGSALLALALLLFDLSSPIGLVIAACVLGAAGGLSMPSLATAVGEQASLRHSTGPGARRSSRIGPARALAVFGLVLSASLTLGPLLESAVLAASHQHLRAAYLTFLPIAILGVLAVGKQRPRKGAEEHQRVSTIESLQGLKALFSNRRWSLAMCAQAIYSVPFAVVVVFGGLVGKSLFQAAPSEVEGAIAVFFAMSLLSRALLAWHPMAAHRVRLFALCVTLTFVGLSLLGLGRGTVVFFVALALLGVPHGFTYPLALALVAESVPREELGGANAGMSAISSVINVVAPLVLGVVLDDFGARLMLLCAGVPVLVLTAVLRRLKDAGRAIHGPAVPTSAELPGV